MGPLIEDMPSELSSVGRAFDCSRYPYYRW